MLLLQDYTLNTVHSSLSNLTSKMNKVSKRQKNDDAINLAVVAHCMDNYMRDTNAALEDVITRQVVAIHARNEYIAAQIEELDNITTIASDAHRSIREMMQVIDTLQQQLLQLQPDRVIRYEYARNNLRVWHVQTIFEDPRLFDGPVELIDLTTEEDISEEEF